MSKTDVPYGLHDEKTDSLLHVPRESSIATGPTPVSKG